MYIYIDAIGKIEFVVPHLFFKAFVSCFRNILQVSLNTDETRL